MENKTFFLGLRGVEVVLSTRFS